jgi:hypothetical protein
MNKKHTQKSETVKGKATAITIDSNATHRDNINGMKQIGYLLTLISNITVTQCTVFINKTLGPSYGFHIWYK